MSCVLVSNLMIGVHYISILLDKVSLKEIIGEVDHEVPLFYRIITFFSFPQTKSLFFCFISIDIVLRVEEKRLRTMFAHYKCHRKYAFERLILMKNNFLREIAVGKIKK